MKKITGFFLALLPLFIIFLMFISGMIVKQYTHVFVNAVEFAQDSLEIQKVDDKVYTAQLEARVLPFNASNPHINYYTSNDSVISIDQNGLVTANDFGEAYVYAVSEENETISAECKVEVWDDKIHDIDVRNDVEARYLGVNQSVLIDAVPVPSTRLKEDPTLYYSTDDTEHIELGDDGDVLAIKETAPEEVVSINIKTASGKITKTLQMQIGEGVTSIDLKDPSDIEIKESNYNLFDQIQLYPESETTGRVLPEDFIYTSDNTDVATIDKQGVIKFSQPGTSTFKAKYVRDEDLTVSKTITSTCSYLLDVAFNRYNFEGNLNDLRDKDIDTKDVNWHLYPESAQDNDDNILVTSSNENVVSVVNNKKLHVNNQAGTAIITAEYKVPGEELTKKDQCVINIYNQNAQTSFIKQESVSTDTLCYPLRQNIDTDQLINENQNVIYEITSSQPENIAEVDQDKELLNFKQEGTVTINAKSKNKNDRTFTVACTESTPIETKTNPTGDIVLEAGKRYAFNSETYGNLYAHWDNDYYKKNFYHGADSSTYWFVPKAGGVFKNTVLYYEDLFGQEQVYSDEINLIIKQDPVDNMIRATEGFPYYSTFNQQVFPTNIITCYPKTATKEDGTPYLPSYQYEPEDPEQVVINPDDQSILFHSSINVNVKASFGSATKDYVIKSTVGSVGKFALEQPESNEIIQSGESIDLTPGNTTTLDLSTSTMYVHDLPKLDQLVDHFEITSLSGNCTGSVTYSNDKLHFNFTAKEDANGSDVIKISTTTFVFYLNVNIDPYITDFNLFFKSIQLKEGLSENNISYTHNLVLDIEVSPIKALRLERGYEVYLNNEDITALCTNNKIDLTQMQLQDENIIKLVANEGSCTRQYKLQMQEQPETIDFDVKEADKNNNVYLSCGATRGALTIRVDGFVDDEFYEQFSINYQKIQSESAAFDSNIKNKIIVRNINLPTERNPGFTNKIDITFTPQSGQSITKTYTIDRDIISKVVLPNHDNFDIRDQKGLQKVHVYGNQSFYTPEEGLIDYYKLPIDIYDYKGSLIKDASQKEQAFKQLDISITSPNSQANTSWKYKDGYVWIDFDEQSLYTPEEIYNNAFVNEQKNVTVNIATHSNYAHAQYEFVPVKGINAYCKQAINNDQAIVLQTNFGLEGGAKDNTPFDDERMYSLEGIYGNGYTINFDASSRYIEKVHDDNDIDMAFMFNTTFQGCNDRDIKISELDIQVNRNFNYPKRFAYNTIKNLALGLFVFADPQPTYVKNCLFYNNHDISINVNADGDTHVTKMYIENTVMFNCSSAAIDQVLGADIYFKGFVDVYNFKNRDVLSNIMGQDFSFLWDVVAPTIRSNNGFQIGADGREYMNSYLLQAQQGDTYFWDGTQYVQSGEGLPTAAKNLTHMVDVDIEWPFTAKAGLWGTPNLQTASDAPSYYDQFDKDGNLRWDFLNIQLRKIMRTTNILILR